MLAEFDFRVLAVARLDDATAAFRGRTADG
jgi:hypothetical protein